MNKLARPCLIVVMLLLIGGTTFVATQGSLHLVLTPSQKPADLLAAGQDFGEALGKLVGMPVRVTVAADYAAVLEARSPGLQGLGGAQDGVVGIHGLARWMDVAMTRWLGRRMKPITVT